MPHLSGLATGLTLVYPPMSNQEAEWLMGDPSVEALLRTSNIYMIGARAEARFDDFDFDDSNHTLSFSISAGDTLRDTVELDVDVIMDPAIENMIEFEMEFGPKAVRIWATVEGLDEPVVAAWFTTEKLVYDRGRGLPGIGKFTTWRDFARYELLYVGIANRTDTFSRLIHGGHKTRQQILTNEFPRKVGARVSDEIVLFAYTIDATQVRVMDENYDPTQKRPTQENIIADAEKAFVALLQPQYNVQRYSKYPIGTDGLFHQFLDTYAYTIMDNVTFLSDTEEFRGATNWAPAGPNLLRIPDNSADIIWVRGIDVSIVRPSELPS